MPRLFVLVIAATLLASCAAHGNIGDYRRNCGYSSRRTSRVEESFELSDPHVDLLGAALRGLTKEDWLGLIPDIGNGVLSRRKETSLNHNASKKLNRKTVTSSLRSETEQKHTPRPSRRTDVRSSPWYEKAAKSIAVSARLSQSFSRDGD
jgi:hypothetical protein